MDPYIGVPIFAQLRLRMLWVTVPIGSIVVPCCGLYLGSYKVIAKRNYYGAYGYGIPLRVQVEGLGSWAIGSFRAVEAYAGLMAFRVSGSKYSVA